MRNRRAKQLVLPALISIAALAGCQLDSSSVDETPEATPVQTQQGETPEATEEPSEGPTATPEETAGETLDDEPDADADETTDASSDEVGSAEGEPRYDRATLMDEAKTQLNCASGSVVLDKTQASYAITEDCDEVEVTGAAASVAAENVKRLTVSAVGAVVMVKEAEVVRITDEASGAVVWWESGSPDVVNDAAGAIAKQNR